MIIKAEQKNTRQPARKVRLVADVVKKMSIEDAVRQLAVVNRKSSLVVLKTLRQAVANATNNFGLSLSDLKIDNIIINDGPALKRWNAVSRGRAHTILKRTCHVLVTLSSQAAASVKPVVKKTAPAKAAEAETSAEVVSKKAVKKAQTAIKIDSKTLQAVKAPARAQTTVKSVQTQKKGTK